jgi:anti-anti-sigma factor
VEAQGMSKDIQVSTSLKGDIAVISIKGDLTAKSGPDVEGAYKSDGVFNTSKILLHFDNACYINSGGLAYLIDIASSARKKEQEIRAYGLSDHFQKIFRMVGLNRCISLFDTEESALNEF